jgi:hypothetical protein
MTDAGTVLARNAALAADQLMSRLRYESALREAARREAQRRGEIARLHRTAAEVALAVRAARPGRVHPGLAALDKLGFGPTRPARPGAGRRGAGRALVLR